MQVLHLTRDDRRRPGRSPSSRFASRRRFNLQVTDLVRLSTVQSDAGSRGKGKALIPRVRRADASCHGRANVWGRRKAIHHHRRRRRSETTSAKLPWMKQRTPFCGGSSTRPGFLICHVSLRIILAIPTAYTTPLTAYFFCRRSYHPQPFTCREWQLDCSTRTFSSGASVKKKAKPSWIRWSAESGSGSKIPVSSSILCWAYMYCVLRLTKTTKNTFFTPWINLLLREEILL